MIVTRLGSRLPIDFPRDRLGLWRIKLALALWVGGFFLPLAIPLVIGLPLSLATKTAVSGLLVLGAPQLLTVIAIALIGRSGFHYFKARLFGAGHSLPVAAAQLRISCWTLAR